MRNLGIVALDVACLSIQPSFGEPAQVLSRFSSWTILKNGDFISLSSDRGNIGVGCGDSFLSYMTRVRISDRSAVVWRPDVKAFYFNFSLGGCRNTFRFQLARC